MMSIDIVVGEIVGRPQMLLVLRTWRRLHEIVGLHVMIYSDAQWIFHVLLLTVCSW